MIDLPKADRFRGFLCDSFSKADLCHDPIKFGDVHLRFELGDQHPNGSDERVTQAIDRAKILFDQFFCQDDLVMLIINDWQNFSREFWPTQPRDYLSTLILNFGNKVIFDETISQEEECHFRQRLLETRVSELDSKKIFEGIANLEQGRSPRINERIYFVNTSRRIVFYMYDDRGCLIYADFPSRLTDLYREKNDWLVDYYREHFDAIFASESTSSFD